MSFEKNKNIFCDRVKELRMEMLKQLEENILPEEMTVDDAFALAKVLHCEVYELFE